MQIYLQKRFFYAGLWQTIQNSNLRSEKRGGTSLKSTIEKLLLAKDVKVNAIELEALTNQWETIQSLRDGLRHADGKEHDIGLVHRLKEEAE